MEVRQLVKPLLQCAITNHNLFTDNATMKQGLPRLPHVTLDDAEPALPSTSIPLAQALPVAQALPAKVESVGSKLLPLALAAATILGTGGAGAGLAALFMGGRKPTITSPAAPVVVESEAGLLSDLQERGFHLPRGDQ